MNNPSNLKLSGSAFIGDIQIFEGINLELQEKEWTCLLGTSGVGKSTILKLFAGLGDHVSLRGNLKSGRNRVSMMAQDDLLLPWLTTLENVLLGPRLRGENLNTKKAIEILKQVGLADHIKKKT